FRLKSLRQLEDYIDVLAYDMGSLTLKSYKVGMLHLKSKSLDNSTYLREIVNIAGIALDLSGRQLSHDSERYLSHSTIEVRQSMDIARLGLLVVQSMSSDCTAEAERLKKFIIQHELIRRMDLYACTKTDMHTMLWRVSQYAVLADVELLRIGEPASHPERGPFLISQITKPHNKPKCLSMLPDRFEYDVLVISAAGLLRRVIQELDMAKKADNLASKGYALRLESDVSDARVCGNIIISSFRRQKREARTTLTQKKVDVGVHVGLHIENNENKSNSTSEKGWVLHNLSHKGAMLQCDIRHGRIIPVSAMLSFDWKVKGWPRYALVRRVQVSLQGYQRLGVEFIRGDIKASSLQFINMRNAMIQGTDVPVLLEKLSNGWHVWMGGDDRYHSALTVSIQSTDSAQSNLCRIYPIGDYGDNYSIFKIAEVLTTSELKALVLAQNQGEVKKRPDQLTF
ncbi:MAG: hypothetical protein Q9M11_08140, partial [Mariprofundaceae bacterium]|nr:hypothetical protein [Mariprofundaceae bacterium]